MSDDSTKTALRARLGDVVVPGREETLGSLGWVTNVAFCDGLAAVTLSNVDLPAAEKVELEKKIVETGRSVEGVRQVNVITAVGTTSSGPIPLPSFSTAPKPEPRPSPKGKEKVFNPQPIPGIRHVIAVASGKGGVGKSTVAVNLALALAKKGNRIGLCDTDIYGPSLPLMLGAHERPDVTPEKKLIPLERHGLKIMSIGFLVEDDTAVIWRGPMVMKMVTEFLRNVEWGELDYLVLDLPPGTGDAQLTIVQNVSLSGGIIVTTPNDIALLDARRGLTMFRDLGVPVIGIVDNMANFECPHCHKTTPIFDLGGGKRTAQELGVPYLGEIPIDLKIRRGGDTGVPVTVAEPESPQARPFFELASAVLRATGGKDDGKKGILASLFSRS